MIEPLLTPAEAAARLGVPVERVRYLVRAGVLREDGERWVD